MHQGKSPFVALFESNLNPLQNLPSSSQLQYIKAYLSGADVLSVIVEPNYFDRDYLDEFSAFYSKSARGYSNICQRVHFFSSKVTTRRFNNALNGTKASVQYLQKNYLGFVVLRPLDVAPFGRTVLSWYPNKDAHSERITPVLRSYECNVLGICLSVVGIPWQQQDRGVSACATIALWSMFHSSAFDANHSVPTTVEITNNAHNGSSGRRAFPSSGLSIPELQEAIFAQKLTPKLLSATKTSSDVFGNRKSGFEPNYLASMCAANIRSGYPVLLIGDYIHTNSDQQHAICCIGFREKEQSRKDPGSCTTMDDETEVFYIHDDNVGPNVRCELTSIDGYAVLETKAPTYVDPALAHPQPGNEFQFRPTMILIAVHNEIRMDAESIVTKGKYISRTVSDLLNQIYSQANLDLPAISYNAQFLNIRMFLSSYLEHIFEDNKPLLGVVRRSIGKNAPPLCLHIGLVSVGIHDGQMSRTIDVLYDTTDSAMNQPVVAHIIYDPKLKEFLDLFDQSKVIRIFGKQIIGYQTNTTNAHTHQGLVRPDL